MNEIKFSSKYPKLHEQHQAVLIRMYIEFIENLHPDFIKYDATKEDGTLFQLPEGRVIVLYFEGDKGIPFTTIRRWTGDKYDYYRRKIGELFEVVVTNED